MLLQEQATLQSDAVVKVPGRRNIARVREARRLTRAGPLLRLSSCEMSRVRLSSRASKVVERAKGEASNPATLSAWGIGSLTGEVLGDGLWALGETAACVVGSARQGPIGHHRVLLQEQATLRSVTW